MSALPPKFRGKCVCLELLSVDRVCGGMNCSCSGYYQVALETEQLIVFAVQRAVIVAGLRHGM